MDENNKSGQEPIKNPPSGKRIPELCKNPPWRPRLYADPKDLEQDIEAYFEYCEYPENSLTVQHLHSKGITTAQTPMPKSIAGLASWLGINRQKLWEWEKREGFGDIIAQARAKIEADNLNKGMAGIYESRINSLNLASNFGYSSKSEVDVKSDSIEDVLKSLVGGKG